MRSRLFLDKRFIFSSFEDNGSLEYKANSLLAMREYFSTLPEFSAMYDAAVSTKTWGEYYSL